MKYSENPQLVGNSNFGQMSPKRVQFDRRDGQLCELKFSPSDFPLHSLGCNFMTLYNIHSNPQPNSQSKTATRHTGVFTAKERILRMEQTVVANQNWMFWCICNLCWDMSAKSVHRTTCAQKDALSKECVCRRTHVQKNACTEKSIRGRTHVQKDRALHSDVYPTHPVSEESESWWANSLPLMLLELVAGCTEEERMEAMDRTSCQSQTFPHACKLCHSSISMNNLFALKQTELFEPCLWMTPDSHWKLYCITGQPTSWHSHNIS